MKKKEWKRKCEELQRENDILYCENMRLLTKDEKIKAMTNEQILECKKQGEELYNGFKKIFDDFSSKFNQ